MVWRVKSYRRRSLIDSKLMRRTKPAKTMLDRPSEWWQCIQYCWNGYFYVEWTIRWTMGRYVWPEAVGKREAVGRSRLRIRNTGYIYGWQVLYIPRLGTRGRQTSNSSVVIEQCAARKHPRSGVQWTSQGFEGHAIPSVWTYRHCKESSTSASTPW